MKAHVELKDELSSVTEWGANVRTERHQPDYILMITVLMLTGIGVVTIYSASMVYDLHMGLSPGHFAVRQLAAAILGLVAFAVCTYIPYHFWYRHAAKCLLASVALLLLVMVPGIGHRSLGASRWIGTSSFHLQPSELAVIAIVLYLAFLLTKKLPVLHDSKRALRPALVITYLLTILVFAEPDMGTAMTLFLSATVLLFASGLRIKPLVLTLAVSFGLGVLGAHMASYRSSRLTAFFHPFQHAQTSGYQLVQGLTAIANGGWTGRGFAASISSTGYLPESYTDFIFAVFTEEWGWLGDIGLLAIFAVLIWRGFHIARYARDRFGSLLAIGLTSTIIIQAAINLGAVTWMLPVTGIPLPFISYGGTDVAINLLAAGILMSVSRETGLVMPEEDTIADIISVDELRAERSQSESTEAKFPSLQQPARVTRLSSRRGRKRGNAQTRQQDVGAPARSQRNLSLSWRAQQEMASDRRGRQNGRNSESSRDKRNRGKR
ncbi:hypothetical protein GCM10025858_31370 [Alicyclobacillus sacchari]|nr:putative peptidoglycan glycosyltransferase FtsW [Alicyclobacillus sacchari]GMA58634.1 hypothetical protein GCM10025858_31370 [Alicyclobacillus sacchari]